MIDATKNDIDLIFGKATVEIWADLNNKRIPVEIKARVDWALTLVEAKINARLRNGPYTIPFVAPFDPIIVDLKARWAGVLLYDGRRVADSEETENTPEHHRVMIDQTIKAILAGTLRLDVETVVVGYPRVIDV